MTKKEPAPSGGRACKLCGSPVNRAPQAQYCPEHCWKEAKKNPKRQAKDRKRQAEKCEALREEGGGVLLTNVKRTMLNSARSRAKKKGIPFNLSIDDIDLPDTCPVLGIPLVLGGGFGQRDSSPSLDRVVPAMGYVKGNVIVTSFRANRIKNDATCAELRQVSEFYAQHFSNNWMVPNG